MEEAKSSTAPFWYLGPIDFYYRSLQENFFYALETFSFDKKKIRLSPLSSLIKNINDFSSVVREEISYSSN